MHNVFYQNTGLVAHEDGAVHAQHQGRNSVSTFVSPIKASPSQIPAFQGLKDQERLGLAALSIRNLQLRMGDVLAIDIPFLRVEPGEVFGVIGPMGSGKSALVDLLSGRKTPTRGAIHIMGRAIQHAKPRSLPGVVAKVDLNTLGDDKTPHEHLLFHAQVMGMHRWLGMKRTIEVLEYVGLARYSQLQVKAFPVALKRRLALARALLHDPQLLLLDELTHGLEWREREALWQMLRSLRAQKKALLLTTSSWEEVDAVCDRAAQFAVAGQMGQSWKRVSGIWREMV